MDQRVQLVEGRKNALVVLKEVLLDAHLGEGEEYAESGVVLEPEDVQRMLLRKLGDLVRTLECVHVRGDLLGHGVDDIVEGPVEHLDQEGELLQDAAVQVSGES